MRPAAGGGRKKPRNGRVSPHLTRHLPITFEGYNNSSRKMKKLRLQVQTSIDGFMADRQHGTGWMTWNWGPKWTWDEALQAHFIALHETIDTVLLSRPMAEEGFIGHWAGVAEDAAGAQYPLAKAITEAQKIVFSKKGIQGSWDNTRVAPGDLAMEVNLLKLQPGRDIIAYGGAGFARALVAANLVDEYHLYVNPVALGAGLSLFQAPAHQFQLKLVSSQAFSCGVTVLTYVPQKAAQLYAGSLRY